MQSEPDVSVVICTYNRGPLLRMALQHVAAQELGDLRFEVWMVNNNSTDDTQQVIDEFIAGRENWHTFFEQRQGLSYARNSGIERARAPIVAFTDDDVAVRPDWIAQIVRTMREHPEVDFIGGKVLPRWHAPPPKWLSRLNWTPLAVTDRGEEPFCVSIERPWCLVGANLSVRKSALDWAGGFNPDFQRVRDGIGSTEDHEFQFRLWRDGRLGMYAPNVVVEAEVQEDRHRQELSPQMARRARPLLREDGHGEHHGRHAGALRDAGVLSAIDRDTRRGVDQFHDSADGPIGPSFTRTRFDFSSTTFGSITSIRQTNGMRTHAVAHRSRRARAGAAENLLGASRYLNCAGNTFVRTARPSACARRGSAHRAYPRGHSKFFSSGGVRSISSTASRPYMLGSFIWR